MKPRYRLYFSHPNNICRTDLPSDCEIKEYWPIGYLNDYHYRYLRNSFWCVRLNILQAILSLISLKIKKVIHGLHTK